MTRKRDYNMDPDPGRMRYDVDESGAAMGWDEIGERLGISGERARQIYRVAMRKLRRNPEAVALFKELFR
jgi:DNA-directed RNA polymerase sigma subunit (sigma70/sigma32)